MDNQNLLAQLAYEAPKAHTKFEDLTGETEMTTDTNHFFHGWIKPTVADVLEAQSMLVAMGRSSEDMKHRYNISHDGAIVVLDENGNEIVSDYWPSHRVFDKVSMCLPFNACDGKGSFVWVSEPVARQFVRLIHGF